ncbi:MAG: hypothetical protein ABUL62_33595 [Myxococcales bacterium]
MKTKLGSRARFLFVAASSFSVLLSACSPGAVSPGSTSRAPAASAAPVEAGAAPGKGAAGVRADCAAWSVRRDGRVRYENNQWGGSKAQGPHEQCLLTREQNGQIQVGWTWNWPGFDPSVFAYPEVVVGWKPWSGGASTDVHFPIRVADVEQLALSYQVETTVTGSYDLAPEIWLTDANASAHANPKSITTEVMFWMDYTEGARPAGKVVDTVTLNGIDYELWQEDNIGLSANGKGWRLLSFKSPSPQHQATIDIAALLGHLVKAKLASSNDFLASVELGNEVMGGTGTTWVKQFDVRLGE